MTSKNFFLYGLVFLLSVISFSFVDRLPIPFPFHYYISNVDSSLFNDSLTFSYQLMKTPSYYLFEVFYNNPYVFFWASFLIDLIFSIFMLKLIYSLNKNYAVTFLVVLVFSPVVLGLFSKILFDPGFRVINVFGYGSYYFSTRYIVGIFSLFSLYFLIKKQYNYSLVFYSFSLLSHPSTALISGLFIVSTFFFIRLNLKYYINFFIASFIGLLPMFLKLWQLKNLNIEIDLLSKKEWYLRLIHDEADDFSIISLISRSIEQCVFTFLFTVFTLYLVYKTSTLDKLTKKILYCSLSLPLFCLIAFGILEYVSLYFDNFIFIDPLIKTQVGYKILSYCFFPIVFSYCYILNDFSFLKKFNDKILLLLKSTTYLLLIIIPLLIYLINPINFQNKKILLNKFDDAKDYSYIDYLNAHYFRNKNETYAHNKYFLNIIEEKPLDIQNELNIFKLNEYVKKINSLPKSIDESSLKYNNQEVYNNLIHSIKKNIPKKSSIIILPYILYLRDVLPDYNFFYLERDHNLGMGSRFTASILSQRLKDLIDVDHKELHFDVTPYMNSDLRRRYLEIDNNKIKYLSIKYPKYEYFITEVGHELDYLKLFEDDFYIIYKISN